jgi:hypothetical protein
MRSSSSEQSSSDLSAETLRKRETNKYTFFGKREKNRLEPFNKENDKFRSNRIIDRRCLQK